MGIFLSLVIVSNQHNVLFFRLFQSAPATLFVWSFFSTAAIFFSELFYHQMWIGGLSYSLLISGFVFYDTILYERFTPARRFVTVILVTNSVTLLVRIAYQSFVVLEPDSLLGRPTIYYLVCSVFICPVLYFVLRHIARVK